MVSRPVPIIRSNVPIIQILCSYISFRIIQFNPSDYSNDYDLLFNSKEVFISAVWCKTSKFVHERLRCELLWVAVYNPPYVYAYEEVFGAFSAARIDTEWQGGDDLAWSLGTASLQQSSIAIGIESLTHALWFKGHARCWKCACANGFFAFLTDYSTLEKSALLFKILFANNWCRLNGEPKKTMSFPELSELCWVEERTVIISVVTLHSPQYQWASQVS